MKKLLFFLAPLALASAALAQPSYPVDQAAVRLDGGLVVPAGYLTLKDETTALTQRSILTFLGSGVTCVDNAGNLATECTITAGTGYNLIMEEGGGLTARSTLNFIGTPLTCADNAGATRTDCTFNSLYDTVQDEGSNLTQRKIINFIGSGVACADNVTKTDCTITTGGAPVGATYITQTADGTLTNEQALGALGTGLVKNTTVSGVLSIYAGATCTNQFLRSLDASGAGTCNTVDVASGGTGIGSGTSGGIPYFSGATTIASSTALTAHGVVVGGGAGTAPTSTSAGTAGQVLTSNGAGADPTFQTSGGGSSQAVFTDEFCGNVTAVTQAGAMLNGWFITNAGTGAGTETNPSTTFIDTENHPCIASGSTGTTNTGVTSMNGISSNTGAQFKYALFGTQAMSIEFIDCIEALSDGTDTYSLVEGFGDKTDGTAPVDGCYVTYTHSVNSGNYVATCTSNSVSSTSNANVGPAVCPAYRKVKISGTGTSVSFTFDGAAAGTSAITTNIPNSAGREFGLQFSILKSAGTTARRRVMDYAQFVKAVTR